LVEFFAVSFDRIRLSTFFKFFLFLFFSGGSLASDELYILDLRGSDDTGLWVTIPVIG